MDQDAFRVVNIATVPLRSPFRYPGGKTWLVPRVRQWLRARPARELIEPFAGGAIVGLTALFEELVERVTLVELDPDVASVWQTIIAGDGERLAEEIGAFSPSPEAIATVMQRAGASVYDRAFATIVRNRVSRGGILAPGAGRVKRGERGRGLASRWYPATLRDRVLTISRARERLRFIQGDGVGVLRENVDRAETAFFIDPPYVGAGRRLYAHSELDHGELFGAAAALRGDFLMTYDDAAPIRALADEHGFDRRLVPMKNTHHARKLELLIGRDLSWAGE